MPHTPKGTEDRRTNGPRSSGSNWASDWRGTSRRKGPPPLPSSWAWRVACVSAASRGEDSSLAQPKPRNSKAEGRPLVALCVMRRRPTSTARLASVADGKQPRFPSVDKERQGGENPKTSFENGTLNIVMAVAMSDGLSATMMRKRGSASGAESGMLWNGRGKAVAWTAAADLWSIVILTADTIQMGSLLKEISAIQRATCL